MLSDMISFVSLRLPCAAVSKRTALPLELAVGGGNFWPQPGVVSPKRSVFKARKTAKTSLQSLPASTSFGLETGKTRAPTKWAVQFGRHWQPEIWESEAKRSVKEPFESAQPTK